jgi:hypothetical protein
MPHFAPRRTIPHHATRRCTCAAWCLICAAAVVADSALSNWAKLPYCIRLSTVRQQWILCGTYSARCFNLWISFRTFSADCPWKFCGNSMGKAEAAKTGECGSSLDGHSTPYVQISCEIPWTSP